MVIDATDLSHWETVEGLQLATKVLRKARQKCSQVVRLISAGQVPFRYKSYVSKRLAHDTKREALDLEYYIERALRGEADCFHIEDCLERVQMQIDAIDIFMAALEKSRDVRILESS